MLSSSGSGALGRILLSRDHFPTSAGRAKEEPEPLWRGRPSEQAGASELPPHIKEIK